MPVFHTGIKNNVKYNLTIGYEMKILSPLLLQYSNKY